MSLPNLQALAGAKGKPAPAPVVAPAAPVDPKMAQVMEALFGPKPPDRAKMSWRDAQTALDEKKDRARTMLTALMEFIGEDDIEIFTELVDDLDIEDFRSHSDLREEKEEAEAIADRVSFVADFIPTDLNILEQARIEQFFQELRP